MNLKSEIEILGQANDLPFENENPTEMKLQVMVRRKGMGREYAMHVTRSGKRLTWNGTKNALNMINGDAPRCNGNLKLLSQHQPSKILAI